MKLIIHYRRTIVAVTCLLAFSVAASGQTTWRVDDDAPNDPGPGDPAVSDPLEDGSSDHPFDAIQEAIDAAIDGDTVLVDDGTYTGVGNRDMDFSGRLITVRSAGGAAACVIDCQELGRAFYFRNDETADAVLEGLTIQNGYADPNAYVDPSGGAIYCDYSSPTITDCVIMNNTAYADGGGIFCYYSHPTIIRCDISNNTAYFHAGGGIYLKYSHSTITECTFSGNASTFGGGAYCQGQSSFLIPTITGCTFSANLAHDGAGIYCPYPSPTIHSCSFLYNDADGSGGGMYCNGRNTTSECVFRGNHARDGGGGISCQNSNGTISDCSFNDNSGVLGGGVNLDESSPLIQDCEFIDNDAGGGGGLAASASSDALIVSCEFVESVAVFGGGAFVRDSDPTFVHCSFLGNATGIDAVATGGGMANWSAAPVLVNCIMAGNTSKRGAAAYNRSDSTPTFINCTITENEITSMDSGVGAISDNYGSSSVVVNSVLWRNSMGGWWYSESTQIAGGAAQVNYSCVDGWTGDLGGVGNFGADPIFARLPDGGSDGWGDDPYTPDIDEGANDDYGDLRLQADSPCIDAGDNTALPADVADLDGDGDVDERTPLDLGGLPRFMNDLATTDTGVADPPDYPEVVDIGCHEFVACVGDLDGDGAADLDDLATLLANYGQTGGANYHDGDLNGDGSVSLADLATMLAAYAEGCG